MPTEKLTHDFYGKSDVRVTRVIRRGRRHELVEMSVDVELTGDFAASYLDGDNRRVVATDSMKNTVYVLARQHKLDSIESFAATVVDHFVDTYDQVRGANVTVRMNNWKRIRVRGREHPHAFESGGAETRVCSVGREGREHVVSAGVLGLQVIKTTSSAFADFVRDEYTTLRDADDRIFATEVNAWWTYGKSRTDFNRCYDTIRAALVETFATHQSKAVQQTLYAMAQAALRRCRAAHDIGITLPNKHRLLVNLAPFDLPNDNDLFVWTDEPYGNIFGHVQRS